MAEAHVAVEQPSFRVVNAVADAEGVSPLDLPPLAEYIDPDALESAIRSMPAAHEDAGSIDFVYAGHDVVVDGHGRVRVNGETL